VVAGVPTQVTAVGNAAILENRKLGLFCSRQCPGELILKSYDLMQAIRDAGITVISGFHAPMDRECLRILLRGKQPIIICPARSIEGMRIRTEFRQPQADGRLLFLSPFQAKAKRMTAVRAEKRNRLVAALADALLVIHAAPGSKTEQLGREAAAAGKAIFTVESGYNNNLGDIGAKPVTPDFTVFFTRSQGAT
jgi:predicted Rossmann fold nucleotide-binding protein DprA/Smf involved in DNA uptake